jgi:hypothetical protein
MTGVFVPACVTVTDARHVKRWPVDAVGPAMLVDEMLRVGSGRGLQVGQGAAAETAGYQAVFYASIGTHRWANLDLPSLH